MGDLWNRVMFQSRTSRSQEWQDTWACGVTPICYCLCWSLLSPSAGWIRWSCSEISNTAARNIIILFCLWRHYLITLFLSTYWFIFNQCCSFITCDTMKYVVFSRDEYHADSSMLFPRVWKMTLTSRSFLSVRETRRASSSSRAPGGRRTPSRSAFVLMWRLWTGECVCG